MSIPGPMKATSLTVRNTLHANETWIETLHVKNKNDGKFTDITKYVNEKVEGVIDMEIKLKTMIEEFNRAIEEIKQFKMDKNSTEQVTIVEGPQGIPGIPGPQGPPGSSGKIGPRGLRGLKGDSLNQISLASDVDLKGLKDGDVLQWSSSLNKWTAVSIYED